MGDVKLLAMIAAFLGFGESVLALFAGAVAASVYGVALMARRKAGGETKLPFGSFLAVGGLFAALFGPDWWRGMWGCCGEEAKSESQSSQRKRENTEMTRG